MIKALNVDRSYSRNSLQGGYIRDYIGLCRDYVGVYRD